MSGAAMEMTIAAITRMKPLMCVVRSIAQRKAGSDVTTSSVFQNGGCVTKWTTVVMVRMKITMTYVSTCLVFIYCRMLIFFFWENMTTQLHEMGKADLKKLVWL